MAGIHQIAVNYILAKITGGKVTLGSIFSYKTRYELGDLADDDLVTKYLLGTITPAFAGFKQPFSAVSSKTIANWQIDIPAGFTQTYAQLLGNDIKPYVFTGSAHNWTKTDFTMTVVTDTDDITVNSVTIDWGFSSGGYIQW